MTQQTAVEWLIEQLTEVDYGCINKTFLQNNNSLAGHKLRELFEQAKQMEKNQMHKVASFWRGKENEIEKPIFEQYYNETFGK